MRNRTRHGHAAGTEGGDAKNSVPTSITKTPGGPRFGVASFLASDDAGFITGQTINCDGGLAFISMKGLDRIRTDVVGSLLRPTR